MADSNDEKERLNNNEFAELIPHLPLADLLQIEYCLNSWCSMIRIKDSTKVTKIFDCNICGVAQSGVKNLYAHIDGKKHKLKMKTVKQFFHPEYTYAKEQVKLASGIDCPEKNAVNTNANAKEKNTTEVISKASKNDTTFKSNVVKESASNATVNTAATTQIKTSTKTIDVTKSTAAAAKPSTVVSKSKIVDIEPPITNCESKKSSIPLKQTKNSKDSEIAKKPTTLTKLTTKKIAPTAEEDLKSKDEAIIPDKQCASNVQEKSCSTLKEHTVISNAPNKILTSTKTNKADETNIENVIKVEVKEASSGKQTTQNQSKKEETMICEDAAFISSQLENTQNKNTADVPTDVVKANIIDVNASKEQLVINPFALKLDGKTKAVRGKNIAKCTATIVREIESAPCNDNEVIVIDDDKISDVEKDDESNDKGKQKKKMLVKNANDDEPLPKKQKTSLKTTSEGLGKAVEGDSKEKTLNVENENQSRYQSNIVVIPTVHKNKMNASAIARIKNLPHFSTKIFSCKPSDDIHGLVGVEYVIKILKSREDISPKYECGLCELVLDGFAMQNHLVGYNHRLKFCEKHFPTAIRQYRQYMGNIPQHEVFKVMTPILQKLAIAIEEHHGRDLPYECLDREFSLNRHEVLSKVFSCRHASEQYGPTFTHVVDSKEVDEIIAERHNYKPKVASQDTVFDTRPGCAVTKPSKNRISPSRPRQRQRQQARQRQPAKDSYSALPSSFGMYPSNATYPQFKTLSPYPHAGQSYAPVDDETHKLMVANFLRETVKSSNRGGGDFEREHFERQDRSRSRSADRSHHRYRSDSHRERNKHKSLSPLRHNDIWQAYRHLVDQKLHELDEIFVRYRNDPEIHPLYDEEWQKFWKCRKEEIMNAGLDHRTHNYQPEWVRFFNVRIEELYNEAVENVKIKSRERLCLPMTNDDLVDIKYHVQVVDNKINKQHRQKVQSDVPCNISSTPEVVAVLRLMTALEEQLGSLGPKIIDLLSKALQIEKTHPRQVNEIILTTENCTLLETAMEKFKGLIIAGLFEGSKERALKKTIKDVGDLLIYALNKRVKSPIKEPQAPMVPAPDTARQSVSTSVPMKQPQKLTPTTSTPAETMQKLANNKQICSILAQADKKELATKLAAALTAQGKTDFDPEQLQNIIAVYTLLEKKKREAAIAARPEVAVSSTITGSSRTALSDTLAGFLNPNPSNFLQSNLQNNDYVEPTQQSEIGQFENRCDNRSADMNAWQNESNFEQNFSNYDGPAPVNTLYPFNSRQFAGSFQTAYQAGGPSDNATSMNTRGNYLNNTNNNNSGMSNNNRGGLQNQRSIGSNNTVCVPQQQQQPQRQHNNNLNVHQNQNRNWMQNSGGTAMRNSKNHKNGGNGNKTGGTNANWRRY